MKNQDKFKELLAQYLDNTISEEDCTELFTMIQLGEFDQDLLENILSSLRNKNIKKVDFNSERAEKMLSVILRGEEKVDTLIVNINKNKKLKRIWLSAAIFIGLIITGALFLVLTNQNGIKDSISSFHSGTINDMQVAENSGNSNFKINLSDGSLVVLEPGSKLTYPLHFASDKREVKLEGAGFFDVTHNSNRPFYVYYKNIITHVLGTSFFMRENNKSGDIEVEVRTGKVNVYENKEMISEKSSIHSTGVILKSNQKVIYNQKSRNFQAELVDVPLPVLYNENKEPIVTKPDDFIFESIAVKEILEKTRKLYNVEILVENEAINNCLFTGNLSEENLFTKLNLICAAIDAKYEIQGTIILIKGKGCPQ